MTFSPPELFRRMHADGVCSYGATYEEWLTTWKQRALHDPPALLMAVDFEWMSLADIQRWPSTSNG